MPGFIFTDKAEKDLINIIDFTVEQWGAEKAHKYINGLEETAQIIADNPEIGINRESLLEGLSCFPYESHILYYYKQANQIAIIRVLHQNMEPKHHL